MASVDVPQLTFDKLKIKLIDSYGTHWRVLQELRCEIVDLLGGGEYAACH